MQEFETKLQRLLHDEIDMEIDVDDLTHESILKEFKRKKRIAIFWLYVWSFGCVIAGASAAFISKYVFDDTSHHDMYATVMLFLLLIGAIRNISITSKLCIQKELKLMQFQISKLASKQNKQ
ncbi:hypothetical protein JD969_00450 [Planctomycetota bacterium]|nr:hypothetical protein JD969_00450 [Planctomycetota bacterium]